VLSQGPKEDSNLGLMDAKTVVVRAVQKKIEWRSNTIRGRKSTRKTKREIPGIKEIQGKTVGTRREGRHKYLRN
jgi:hypothetical protein